MKAMVIGISPNYNYPGTIEKWSGDTTYYASNLGASLIVRSIMKEFDAEYVDNFQDITFLKNKFDTCFLGLATHANTKRDIWPYVKILEKLEMKVVIVSLGVSDYVEDTSTFYKLHPSVIRLLELSSESTTWIGVRGPYTASILQQNGFKNVVPIGCPTLYSNLTTEFAINTKETYTNPLIVYHRTLVGNNYQLIKDLPLLGQDFEDEAFFTDKLMNDKKLQNIVNSYYNGFSKSNEITKQLKSNGIFTAIYDDWFKTLAKYDFVFGPRLHGCIGSLLQGVPAILTPRDLRMNEIVDFFNLPNIPYSELPNYKLEDVYAKANFSKFQNTYKLRYKNFLSFIEENNLESQFKKQKTERYSFSYTTTDIQTFNHIANSQIKSIIIKNEEIARKKRFFYLSYYKKNIRKGLNRIYKLIKK